MTFAMVSEGVEAYWARTKEHWKVLPNDLSCNCFSNVIVPMPYKGEG
jgi:hypothetical protein